MRIVIAPDKFKGSLSAVEAASAMAEGIRLVEPGAEVEIFPMADGGEGTVEAIATATGAEVRQKKVQGPLPGQDVLASWGFIPALSTAVAGLADGAVPTAVIEMALASGFTLVPESKRDPMLTTTRGTGELVLEALDAGCRNIIVGIGGSATVDGGTGLAEALGYRFLDDQGRELPGRGSSLREIRTIDPSGRDPRIPSTRFLIASDVDSPLTGPHGAARVFGPQKGATPDQVEELDRGLGNLGNLIGQTLGIDVLELPGAGAAGGLGAGLVAFCGATVSSGARLVAEVTGLASRIKGADLVLTGEGSYDSQTARGKTPAAVAAMAAEAGVPAIIVAGSVADDSEADGAPVFCVTPGPVSLEDAMRNAREFVVSGTARPMRLMGAVNRG
jgi:glycerate 2-kinase